MMGVSMPIRTPIFDAIGSGWETARLGLHTETRRYFHDITWKTSNIIPFALFWSWVMSLLIRKC